MAERGQNLIGRAQILIDRLGLRRRLDNDDIHVIPMAYGRNEGRFREIRIGRFAANMGGEGVLVKSTDVEREPNGPDRVSKKLQNTSLSALLSRIRAAQAGTGRPLPCCSSPPTTHPTFKAQRSLSMAGGRHPPPARRSIAARRNFRKTTNPISTLRRNFASKLC